MATEEKEKHPLNSSEDPREKGNRSSYSAQMADPSTVAKNGSDANLATSSFSERRNDITSTQRTKRAPSATQEAHTDSNSLISGYLKDKGLSTTATTVIEKAWRSGTRKQYAT